MCVAAPAAPNLHAPHTQSLTARPSAPPPPHTHPHPRTRTHSLPLLPQSQLEKLIEKNYYLNRSAKDAYRSYLLAYSSHSLKNIFSVDSVDLEACCKGFGFTIPPRVNLNVSATGGAGSKRHKAGNSAERRVAEHGADPAKRKAAIIALKSGGGHGFSASNPYGKRDASDFRQFSR